MISKEEKKRIVAEHWDPTTSYESFCYWLARWSEEFKSGRAAMQTLAQKASTDTLEVQANTLYYHMTGRFRTISMETAVAVLAVILREG